TTIDDVKTTNFPRATGWRRYDGRLARAGQAIAGLAAALAVLLSAPTAASAHTELLGTSPSEAAVITAPVNEVTLTFSGPVQGDGGTVTVTDSGGRTYNSGQLSVIDFVVHQPVAVIAAGSYRVSWSIVAGDGHPMSGEFTFEFSLPPELRSSRTPDP